MGDTTTQKKLACTQTKTKQDAEKPVQATDAHKEILCFQSVFIRVHPWLILFQQPVESVLRAPADFQILEPGFGSVVLEADGGVALERARRFQRGEDLLRFGAGQVK